MQFTFFDAADHVLFVRDDPESATWTVEERSMQALFPFHADKEIQRGMRIGFTDETGVFQPFEIRKVRNYEPDHYQEITAEHIVIAELTDEHYYGAELTNVTPQAALSGLLAGTLWAVGNVTATNLSSVNLGMGSVYQNLRSIETNWNVYITPRVTFDASGITGRYLDIAPAGGTWRGLRLSINKNADEMGVTVDDTETLTALFGYGRSNDNVPLTFAGVTWAETADHPAKPAGQTYLEDPAATAAYGRNGRARFGYYQNSDITDANVLIQKTWEALKATSAPRVSIDCMVRDLYRLGYADEPVRLHDTAIVDIEPTGTSVQLEIIRLTVDLLDPTATRPTIGAYIPNIIYIQRQTSNRASGGRGGGASGRRGGGTNAEDQISEFETEIQANNYEISLRAYQRDMTNVENILRAAGISINAQGVAIYATDLTTNLGSMFNVQSDRITNLVTRTDTLETGQSNMEASLILMADQIASKVSQHDYDDTLGEIAVMESSITQLSNSIESKVSYNDYNGNEIASRINQTATTILLSASKINLEGYVTASELSATNANIANLVNGSTTAQMLKAASLEATSVLTVANKGASWHSVTKTGYVSQTEVQFLGDNDLSLAHYHSISASENNGVVSFTLGAPQRTEGSTNFNIAATQFYQDGVAAAFQQGTDNGAWNYAAVGATNTGTKSWASDSKSCVINVTVLDRNNRTYGPYEITVDTRKAYSDGWTKGFQDGSEA